MTDNNNVVNLAPHTTTAPLQNVALCARLLERAIHRPAHLPGLVCMYGPSGYGKSIAAAYAANKFRAYYVECKSSWTKKALLRAILREQGIAPAYTIAEMTDQIAEQLALSGRPLIVDEMDHIVERKAVETIRDLYEGSNAAIMLIGEELMPAKLQKWERFHNRMLGWQPAQPASVDDTAQLAKLYCRQVEIAPDLLQRVQTVSRGVTRRICINLYNIEQEALNAGLDRIDLATWGTRDLYTGDAPARRV